MLSGPYVLSLYPGGSLAQCFLLVLEQGRGSNWNQKTAELSHGGCVGLMLTQTEFACCARVCSLNMHYVAFPLIAVVLHLCGASDVSPSGYFSSSVSVGPIK